jgi:hypothetical protein
MAARAGELNKIITKLKNSVGQSAATTSDREVAPDLASRHEISVDRGFRTPERSNGPPMPA